MTDISGVPADHLDHWSRDNWDKVHPMIRQDCLDGLRAEVPSRLLGKWRGQHNAGKSIGSDDTFFHHGSGQTVRNILRKYLTDGELPGVDYFHDAAGNLLPPDTMPQDGVTVTKAKNWDDYYLGALQELCEKP